MPMVPWGFGNTDSYVLGMPGLEKLLGGSQKSLALSLWLCSSLSPHGHGGRGKRSFLRFCFCMAAVQDSVE